ncbi:MAG: hypothetical protein H7Z41_14220 [Cytophagales bacterium]|nr:hypothetical protein [Armatimonadota bacterium]
MHVNSALVVDEIRLHDDGHVDLIGLREDLYFDQVPVILQSLSLFVELEITPEDRGGKHVLELRLLDHDGRVAQATPIKFDIPKNYDRPTAHVDPTLFEVTFHQFGPHYLDLIADGVLARRLFLNVQQRDEA